MLRIKLKAILSLTFVKFYISFICLCLQRITTLPVGIWGKEKRFGRLFICSLVIVFALFLKIGQKNSMVSWKKKALEPGQSELEFQLCHLLVMWPQKNCWKKPYFISLFCGRLTICAKHLVHSWVHSCKNGSHYLAVWPWASHLSKLSVPQCFHTYKWNNKNTLFR